MSALHAIDLALFRLINRKLANPVLDVVLPPFNSNAWFIPLVILGGVWLLWKGGARGRLFVLSLTLVLGLGDTIVINSMKKGVARPRPYVEVTDARLLVGEGSSGSMPSSHTSTWFAATVISLFYYRRTWRVMLPLALVMGFSRVYLGAHYPTDVLMGAIIGAGYAVAGVWLLQTIWRFVGQRWFRLWWSRVPALVPDGVAQPGPESPRAAAGGIGIPDAELDRHWIRLGYALTAVLCVARLAYVGSGRIELTEDEAYQWLWSKHLALSYYSKPPMIALLHYLGTSLWGDTAFGVRFCPPLISAGLSVMLLRFFAREVGGRPAFVLLLMSPTAPLLAVGSVLMTIDPPLVLFWTAAMLSAWQALQPAGTTTQWIKTGFWIGLALLSKYSALFFIPSLAILWLAWPPARVHLRRAGPWLALIPIALALVPVVVWNAQHGWVTVQHVSENAKLDKPWEFTARFFFEFMLAEAGLLNPVFFVAMLWAVARFPASAQHKPLSVFLLAMGAPLFFGYWLYTLHSRVQPNWIAPAVVPLLGFTVVYWEQRWREGCRPVKGWLAAGLGLGGAAVLLLHDTSLVGRMTHASLPASVDPTRRARAIRSIAAVAGEARRALEQSEHRETFIIASHYGLTGQLSFYLPEARAGLPHQPLVYVRSSPVARNQFFFWPEYRYAETRKGQNAIFISANDTPQPVPAELAAEFEAVTDLGLREIKAHNQVLHRVQLYACRNLR